ncbi:MAG: nucleoside recognition domain-containing protein [Peptoniphilus sp.]|nr:nucleoside recognition domain-containing protein [Peptoniphilus sp.]
MENQANIGEISQKTKVRSVIFSLIGVFFFFVNVNFRGKTTVPMVHVMNLAKDIITKPVLNVIIMICCLAVLLMAIIVKANPEKHQRLGKYYKKTGVITFAMYIAAAIFSVLTITNKGPEYIIQPSIGGSAIAVAGDVFLAVVIAGSLVTFLLEFGFFEFLGYLMEPIMRRLFLLPGKSAVDALSSFVASSAVGVMITSDLYVKKAYTAKEASAITTNFSVCSLGAFAFLSANVGVEEHYLKVVITGLIITFLMAIIMVRIYPLSRKEHTYIDGTVQTEEERAPKNYHSGMFKEALSLGFQKASTTQNDIFLKGMESSFMFGLKVVSYVVSLSVISLFIATYTPIVRFIGAPMVPILNLLGMPNAEMIAPSTLVGIFGLAIPTVLLKGKAIELVSAFFIVVLSTSQIIFFTESANAMLESEIPVKFGELILIFVIRTIILVPIVAVVAKLLF